ncbi:hypothetical protein ACAN107058_22835 [Paracidovorax anthurii]|uniref:Uncharacterized protein n=1 Tax=Paracidovorax anthurii TaxID=78229 RepID=A0A328YC92_9BURK|nr:hypothetical protein AX018_11114 [Paracidovorax anthurii]
MGCALVFLGMALTGKFTRAVSVVMGTGLMLGVLAALGNGIGLLEVLLLGPWLAFAVLLASALIPSRPDKGRAPVDDRSPEGRSSPWNHLP